MKIKISADSTCDLPRSIVEKNDIGIMPLYIIRGDESLRDGIDITPPELYEYARETGKLCGTSAVTVADYITAWTGWLRDYDAVVHIAFSSELSASCNNARIAASEVPNVYIVDTLNLSTGCGHLVLDACELASQGMDAAEIKETLDKRVPKLEVSFVIDTLEYLKKGGRCTSLQALGANLLGLKPCIEVRDGKMSTGKKYRGRIEDVYTKYITERLSGRTDIDTRRLFITDSGITEEERARLRELAGSLQPFEEIISTEAGCTVSGHCGPKTMGVLFYTK